MSRAVSWASLRSWRSWQCPFAFVQLLPCRSESSASGVPSSIVSEDAQRRGGRTPSVAGTVTAPPRRAETCSLRGYRMTKSEDVQLAHGRALRWRRPVVGAQITLLALVGLDDAVATVGRVLAARLLREKKRRGNSSRFPPASTPVVRPKAFARRSKQMLATAFSSLVDSLNGIAPQPSESQP